MTYKCEHCCDSGQDFREAGAPKTCPYCMPRNMRSILPICCLGPKANGKPRTNRDYFSQGRSAQLAGFRVDECPYYSTSTAETQWRKGFAS